MDSSSIVSDVAETATQAGGGFLSELKKIGQSAASQITGSPNAPSPPVKPPPPAFSPTDEVLKFGRTAAVQVTGDDNLSDQDVKDMARKDKEFSAVGSAQVRAQIAKIYEEHQARRKRAKMTEEKQKEQLEESKEKQGELAGKTQKREEINSAIAKTHAEIKNYGAE